MTHCWPDDDHHHDTTAAPQGGFSYARKLRAQQGTAMTRIDLPWERPPLTKNQVRRMHHQAEAKARKQIVEAVKWLTRHTKPMIGANITLHWQIPDRRRRDGDGAAPTLAACIDGLVRAGVLPDDSWVHVPHSGVTCHPPVKGQPGRLWLELTNPDT